MHWRAKDTSIYVHHEARGSKELREQLVQVRALPNVPQRLRMVQRDNAVELGRAALPACAVRKVSANKRGDLTNRTFRDLGEPHRELPCTPRLGIAADQGPGSIYRPDSRLAGLGFCGRRREQRCAAGAGAFESYRISVGCRLSRINRSDRPRCAIHMAWQKQRGKTPPSLRARRPSRSKATNTFRPRPFGVSTWNPVPTPQCARGKVPPTTITS